MLLMFVATSIFFLGVCFLIRDVNRILPSDPRAAASVAPRAVGEIAGSKPAGVEEAWRAQDDAAARAKAAVRRARIAEAREDRLVYLMGEAKLLVGGLMAVILGVAVWGSRGAGLADELATELLLVQRRLDQEVWRFCETSVKLAEAQEEVTLLRFRLSEEGRA
ncbi:hypothetical protein [Caulobacter endophyticus]|uniref:hypothetical protein n=1 Tax=Caulobacter endophyticus TaxID=2172652 RepID=UPI00240E9CB1|nr:hypothetical protein [Caulobacter endophyticus]MDG2530535.1 hypothetical protein [Caulobacter endophyticus]